MCSDLAYENYLNFASSSFLFLPDGSATNLSAYKLTDAIDEFLIENHQIQQSAHEYSQCGPIQSIVMCSNCIGLVYPNCNQ